MNKLLQIIGLLALLSIGFGKAQERETVREITPEILDKEFLKKAINLIIEDRNYYIKSYRNLENELQKSKIHWEEYYLTQEKKALDRYQELKTKLDQKQAAWFDQPSPELIKDFENIQEIVGDFETRSEKHKIAEEKLKEKKELLQLIQSKIENLEKEKKHPVSYMITKIMRSIPYFARSRSFSLNEIKKAKQKSEKRLQSRIKSYNDEQNRIEKELNEKYNVISDKVRLLTEGEKETHYLMGVLYRQMQVSEVQLLDEAKDKEAFYELMQNYIKDIEKRPKKYDQRVSLWTQKPSGTYYSMLEPELGLTSYAPTWLSNAWTRIKEYTKPYIDSAKQYLESRKGEPLREQKMYERIASPKYPAFRSQMLRFKKPEELKKPTLEALKLYQPQGYNQ